LHSPRRPRCSLIALARIVLDATLPGIRLPWDARPQQMPSRSSPVEVFVG